MFTIIDQSGKVLFAKYDNEVIAGQTAISEICMIENPEDKEIFFNFETHEFYISND